MYGADDFSISSTSSSSSLFNMYGTDDILILPEGSESSKCGLVVQYEKLSAFQKDLVNGYYRINFNQYIYKDITYLLMLYLWILDEFDKSASSEIVNIFGLNNNICQYMPDPFNMVYRPFIRESVLAKNVIAASKVPQYNYHHWQLKILNAPSSREMTFNFGLKSVDDNKYDVWYRMEIHNHQKDDVLDIYLDLNKPFLCYYVNNEWRGRQYSRSGDTFYSITPIIKSRKYRFVISIYKNVAVELLSYHHSQFYDINNHEAVQSLGFIRSLSNISDDKLKYLQLALKTNPNFKELQNEYINYMVAKEEFDEIYQFIVKHTINALNGDYFCHALEIGNYFCHKKEYKKALKMYSLIKNDDIFIGKKECFYKAYCHSLNLEPRLALKYYDLCLQQENMKDYHELCFIKMGDAHRRFKDYKNAIECYSKITDDAVNHKNLERKMAFSYKEIKDYDNAVIWYQKYIKKFPDNIVCILEIINCYAALNDFNKASEYYKIILSTPYGQTNYSVHFSYAEVLLYDLKIYENAIIYFEAAINLTQNDTEINECVFQMGYCYELQNDYENALIWYKKSNNNYEIGNMYYKLNQYKNALEYYTKLNHEAIKTHNLQKRVIECYEKERDTNSNDVEPVFNIARFYENCNDNENAEKHYKMAVSMDKTNHFELNFYYAVFLSTVKNDYKNAIILLSNLLETGCKNNDKYKTKCIKYIGHCYEQQKDYKNALIWYGKNQEMNKNDPMSYQLLAAVFEEMNDFENAEKNYIKAINTDKGKNNYRTYSDYADFLIDFKKYDKSISIHKKAIEVLSDDNKDDKFYNNTRIAYCYESQQDYKNAILYFKKSIEFESNDNGEHKCINIMRIGYCYQSQQEYKTAITYFQKAMDLTKDIDQKTEMLGYIGDCYESQQEYKTAIIYFQKAIDLTTDIGKKGDFLSDISLQYEHLNDFDSAIFYAQQKLKLNPNNIDSNASTLNNLGYYYMKIKNYELSYKYLTECIDISGDRNLINGNLANCLYEMKKYDEATPYFKKSLLKKQDLNHPDIGPKCLENYGNLLFIKGDYKKSIFIYKQLIETDHFNKNENENKDKIYYLLAIDFYKISNLEKALEFATKAIQIKPNQQKYKQLIQTIKQNM